MILYGNPLTKAESGGLAFVLVKRLLTATDNVNDFYRIKKCWFANACYFSPFNASDSIRKCIVNWS